MQDNAIVKLFLERNEHALKEASEIPEYKIFKFFFRKVQPNKK